MLGRFTVKEVLARVDQLAVMQHLVNGATLGEGFCSPFRVDRGPGCWLSTFDNNLYYHDPKDTLRSGKGIVNLWIMQYNVPIQLALNQIVRFNGVRQPRKFVKKPPAYFGYGLRSWEDYDEQYWEPYGLTIDDLEYGEPSLLPCHYFEYHSKKLDGLVRTYSRSDRPLYVYVWEDAAKGYSPLNKSKAHRFLGTAGMKHFYHYIHPDSDYSKLVICSGGKDAKVVFKAGYDTFALNGEMYKPEEIPLEILKEYEEIIIALDNDDTGISFAQRMCVLLNPYVPTRMIFPEFKDWGKQRIAYSQSVFEDTLNELIL